MQLHSRSLNTEQRSEDFSVWACRVENGKHFRQANSTAPFKSKIEHILLYLIHYPMYRLNFELFLFKFKEISTFI